MNEQKIWNKLINSGMTKAGAAGMMGNLYAESALNPKNLQNTYEKSLGYSDESYTSAVDSGKYTNFVHDQAGYGLAQWTYYTRKQALLNFAKSRNASIGNLDMQLDFLIKELKEDYPAVWTCLCSASSVKTVSDAVMTKFECPADVSASAKNKRYEYSQKYYSMFASTAVPTKSVSEVAKEVLNGLWGDGDERKSKLISAGYDYNEVQTFVNVLLNSDSSKNVSGKPTKRTIDVSLKIDDKTYSGTVSES